ncbi:Bug family tripartite tricarboxylate transporter substrate binding protein [Xylophilus sp. ASV27]|uniref:Bug family tripartite tricarboxylate transporter substrate binding protein n=1 Tax=Xylophilus sp. ASV27 TaxID=2795129 RepID=UPI001E427D4D|nr:tripartite tricarboxylate transporter substrate-binding protein [Xylophilus sp. ASV27]
MYASIRPGTRRSTLLSIFLSLSATATVAEDKFPTRPVRIIVGSEAGSAPDLLARVVASEMGPLLGQAIIVENRAGAAGTIGAGFVASSPADGYSLLMGTVSNVALAPSFYPIRYNPNTSFTPIGMVASVPLVLVATPALGVHSFLELQAKARQLSASDRYAYSSPGVGGPQHLAGVLLQAPLGVALLHIPYKSGGAATTAVAAGDVQLAFAGIPAAQSLALGKKVVSLFVTSPRRSSAMPEVPSATEAGLPSFDIDNWHALFAPANTPPAVRATLEAALIKALAVPAVKEQFQKAGADVASSTSSELAAKVASEAARWSKIVADNKLKAE